MAYNPITNISEAGYTGSSNPTELDYLRPNGFRFQIHNIPNVSFFCQAANLPQMSIGSPQVETPLSTLVFPGEKLSFGELIIRFLVQEDMANYVELYNWLTGLGSPESHKQFTEYVDGQRYRFPNQNPRSKDLGQFSDADLFILDSNNNPNVKVTFIDAFPISLEGLDFDISTGDQNYFVGVAAFRYRLFKVETVK